MICAFGQPQTPPFEGDTKCQEKSGNSLSPTTAPSKCQKAHRWFLQICNPVKSAFGHLVDATAIKEKRKFTILATGQNTPESKNTYIKTIFSENAKFVFHVFEIHENENREI